jgi:pyruvate,water dikinase
MFPLCAGLLVERGGLLSHSAVVAREFGIPTIVGVSGGLMSRLKTGQRVRMDGSTGQIEVLTDA